MKKGMRERERERERELVGICAIVLLEPFGPLYILKHVLKNDFVLFI